MLLKQREDNEIIMFNYILLKKMSNNIVIIFKILKIFHKSKNDDVE